MKRLSGLILFVVAVALSGSAFAASLSNLSGQTCGEGIGTWHFVNNQTGGAADGILSANFSSGQCTIGPSKNTGSTQHFFCVGYGGSLLGASTGALPGRLVLSDFSCSQPPRCVPNPKGEICDDKIDNDCDDQIDEECK